MKASSNYTVSIQMLLLILIAKDQKMASELSAVSLAQLADEWAAVDKKSSD